MTLRSESLGSGEVESARTGLPVRLMSEGTRKISRLEFYPIREATEEAQLDEIVSPLKEEAQAQDDEQLRVESEQMLESIELARREAKFEALREFQDELETKVATERSSILKACEQFSKERARYFADVEAEIVRLALAIAARVLHREVTFDPALLTGVVRVALEKVAEDSAIVLRVPHDAVEMWGKALAASSESAPRIAGDERLVEGECVLETSVGRVELSVRAQLEEIERGFFDLMQQRPA
jgi:flagellar assembly protein FliH